MERKESGFLFISLFSRERFFLYFADFRAIFCGFFEDCFVLLAQMGIEKTPST